jgi:hypothetical protein
MPGQIGSWQVQSSAVAKNPSQWLWDVLDAIGDGINSPERWS